MRIILHVGFIYSYCSGDDNLEVLSFFLILNKHERLMFLKSVCRLRPFVVANSISSHLLYNNVKHVWSHLHKFWMVILPSPGLCYS